jgi:hypothetical protein
VVVIGRQWPKLLGWSRATPFAAYAEVLSDKRASTVVSFLARAVAFYKRHDMAVQRLLTDNGSGYRSIVHAIACRTMGTAT